MITEIRKQAWVHDPDLVRLRFRRLVREGSRQASCDSCHQPLDMNDPQAWAPRQHDDPLRDLGGIWGNYEVLCCDCLDFVARRSNS
jgi:hypothetical protein